MFDCIYRDEVKQKIKERMECLDYVRILSKGDVETLKQIERFKKVLNQICCDIDNIRTADVQPVKQWVKLHDKHPDTEGSYLVCDQYGECEVAKYIPCIKSWFTYRIKGEIRYWIPLPKLPKEGDTNEQK